ncbi:hypothetical protein Nepgr_016652 [Nepenthes gracilis]|uniref:Phosphatidylinositol-3,4,5-trisphosphate 3-phosphatase n=1 Tax=Nepenthes gracilis TaxID=150966 RepID=A0AAD3SQY4_NEPGR|nr:hypothetical protein Nepgr_016652 [Nepenthes gracilis]
MESISADPSSGKLHQTSDVQPSNLGFSIKGSSTPNSSSLLFSSGISSWARSFKVAQPSRDAPEDSQNSNVSKLTFARLTSGLGLHFSSAAPVEKGAEATSIAAQGRVLESFTKGLVDSSRSAVKAVQVKARHIVSQNKRRYQDGGFDLDMTYITETIIAMGFPAGDISSGFFGYVEGFYRNHMDEVIRFFETHHKGKYKVYNLCSERLYDASLFQGKAASFPFDDHNCPPLHLILSFCQSAYTWLKEDIENVVVVHCKAGMGRTGLMISSLLLYLKFCPTAQESIDYFNQKRCIDGNGLVLPSQIRYVKYFERILKEYSGENQPGRRCMLRGFRLHGCPYWIRPSITISDHNGDLFTTKIHPKTKDLMPEDFWISTSKKGVVIFALPGMPGLAELAGDFKIHFHDRHGDFYCWLNTTMIENRTILSSEDLDGYDKRKLPSPRFEVEIVMVDYNDTKPKRLYTDPSSKKSDGRSDLPFPSSQHRSLENKDRGRDDVFSDSDGEEAGASSGKQAKSPSETGSATKKLVSNLTDEAKQLSINGNQPSQMTAVSSGFEVHNGPVIDASRSTDFKAIAADASVFSFGDEDEYESE